MYIRFAVILLVLAFPCYFMARWAWATWAEGKEEQEDSSLEGKVRQAKRISKQAKLARKVDLGQVKKHKKDLENLDSVL